LTNHHSVGLAPAWRLALAGGVLNLSLLGGGLAVFRPPACAGQGPSSRPVYRFRSVDSALASRLAAEHPWTNPPAYQVCDGAALAAVVTDLRVPDRPHYAFVSVDGATASKLAAEHPWTP
jgi:hypothetical protein